MRISIALILLFCLKVNASIIAKSVAFSRVYPDAISALFGVRGGGLFGKGDKNVADDKTQVTDNKDKDYNDDKESDQKMYPAMTQEEIEDWLDHIPVFMVTDKNGSAIVMRNNETSLCYFFMSPAMANVTLNQLQASTESSSMELQVSAFSLGRIWFRILKANQTQEVQIKVPGAVDNEIIKNVEYRLIPDTRDLLGARMLLTMDAGDAVKDGETLTPEVAQAAIKKAMTSSPKFNGTYNEIPLFVIQQMRVVKQTTPEGLDKEPETMLPMYFSLQNMVSTWQKFTSQSPETAGMEPAINLMDLFEIVEKMQKESVVDWRNVILMPPNLQAESSAGKASDEGSLDSQIQIPGIGQTLGDL
jgi:hypothetical protein